MNTNHNMNIGSENGLAANRRHVTYVSFIDEYISILIYSELVCLVKRETIQTWTPYAKREVSE